MNELSPSATALDRVSSDISRVVHPKCEMFRYARRKLGSDEAARAEMFSQAEYLVRNLLEFLDRQGRDSRMMTILDFGAGYGRLTRYFTRLFASVTVADTEREMLDFNRRFGATGFLSPPKSPKALDRHPDRYDLVFSFSVFSHLSPRIWPDWFRRLFRLVEDDGFLILSAHGYELFAKLEPHRFGAREQQADEVVFRRTNETDGRIDHSDYGTTIVTERFVRSVAESCDGAELVQRFGMGEFDRYQDIYAFQRRAR